MADETTEVVTQADEPQSVVETPAVTEEADPVVELGRSKAEVSRLKADLEKRNNDYRALQGSRKAQQERDDVLFGLPERLQAIERSQLALIQAIGSGQTEDLSGQVAKIQAESQQSTGERRFAAEYARLYRDAMESLVDGNGEQILVAETAPELQEVRQQWREGLEARDIRVIQEATIQMQRIARQTERKRATTAQGKAQTAAKKADLEGLDMDLGPTATGGTTSDARFIEEYSEGRRNSKADHERAKKILDNL